MAGNLFHAFCVLMAIREHQLVALLALAMGRVDQLSGVLLLHG